MSDFKGKTVIVSGGAEGIGFSIAQAMGRQGMNVVIGDIDAQQLETAKARLEAQGIKVLGVVMDVTQPADWKRIAEQALARFGKLHMLVNNAGVGGTIGSIEQINEKDWKWVVDVNLMGVVYGTHAIVPLIKQHGEGGWLINVASMAGMAGVPYAGAYTATKVAVVGMSESWFAELQAHNIHVSVLCPAFVKTRIHLSGRNRQQDYLDQNAAVEPSAKGDAIAAHMQKVVDGGLSPEIVGQRVVEAVKAKELYIFTHPNYRWVVQQRFQQIDAAFERAAASPLLADVLNEEIVGLTG